MAYILSAERRGTPGKVSESFARYREYLRTHEDRFPAGVYKLATASWYFDLSDNRSPHDGRLIEMRLTERKVDEDTSESALDLSIRLMNSYNDAEIEFSYTEVVNYALHLRDGDWGHRDWRYDEFRLSEDGHVIHEIEWSGPAETARWEIVASDIRFRITPRR